MFTTFKKHMRATLRLTSLLMLIAFHPTAFAQSVFHCEGADGEMTFSFAPCAAQPEIAAPAEESIPDATLVVLEDIEQVAEPVDIDARIDELQANLDTLRIDHMKAMELDSTDPVEEKAAYNRKSAAIVEELMQLYQEQVAAR